MAKLFSSDTKTVQPIVSLTSQLPFAETLTRLLDYIYTDEVELAPNNVVDIYSAGMCK